MSDNQSPKRVELLSGATASGTKSTWVNVEGYQNLTFYFKTNGNPDAGGACVIEEADFQKDAQSTLQPLSSAAPAVAQTASLIATVDIDATVGTNGQYAYHVGGPGGSFAYAWVRVRMSVTLVTATLDVALVAS